MVRQAFPSLTMACVLYGAYTLYSLFLSPMFSPPPVADQDDKPLHSIEKPRHNVEQAK